MKRVISVHMILTLLMSFLSSGSMAAADVLNMPQGQTSLEFVTVANPGNPGELSSPQAVGAYQPVPDRVCGSVGYVYQIGKYEVTNAQYCDFLNAVAASDPHGLYDVNMAVAGEEGCGITRDGAEGRYTYGLLPERANKPVKWVSFWSACRFANWLHNGQGSGDTEAGAYALTPDGITNNTVTRNAGWKFAVTSEDEWYKAAYHKNDGPTRNYWDYPTGSDTPPTPEAPPGTDMINGSANYDNRWSDYEETDVGAYTAKPSSSPYGTFDQAGNAWEWNETPLTWEGYLLRGSRGGEASSNIGESAPGISGLHAMMRGAATAAREFNDVGFRVVRAMAGVHRFWSPVSSRHFYTVSETEKEMLLRDYSYVWTYEGIAYYGLPDGSDPNGRPVYRFWSPSLSAHFYTIAEAERDTLIRDFPAVWTFEGVAFHAYPEGLQPAGTQPVYRFWSPMLSTHFYTISETEKQWLIDNHSYTWTFEGTAWYAYAPARGGEKSVWFPDYMPLDPNEHGIKTFEWVYGRTGTYTSEIGDSETVPYTSGPIRGTQITNFSGSGDTGLAANDGASVRFLGSGALYLSADLALSAHPSVWSFAQLYDGMVIDQGTWYLIDRSGSSSRHEADQLLLIDIQDVTVPAGTFGDAVIMWYIDANYPFTPLTFPKEGLGLGITLPSSSDTRGYSITDFEIYARNVGLIAHGGVDAASGAVPDLAVLNDRQPDAESISDHVFEAGIAVRSFYDAAADFSIVDYYEFQLVAITDGSVEKVEFLTPSGNWCDIPKLPYRETLIPGGDLDTQWEYVVEVAGYEWEYEAHFDRADGLDAYGDGHYIIRVRYDDGRQDETILWFGIPGTSDPIPQPIQQPRFVNLEDVVPSPVTIEWAPCTDSAVNQINIELERDDREGGYIFETFPINATGFPEPLHLTTGLWQAQLGFEARYQTQNTGGVKITCDKGCWSAYSFRVIP